MVVNGPNGHWPLLTAESEHTQLALWDSIDEAHDAIVDRSAVKAFGAEIYQLGVCEEEVW